MDVGNDCRHGLLDRRPGAYDVSRLAPVVFFAASDGTRNRRKSEKSLSHNRR
jgi:hypothetical protein